jgi:nitrogen fixation-related uncharacterized protein
MRLFLGILLMVAVIVVCVALVPPYWANYQFEDAIKTEALMATSSTKTEDAIRETVYRRAKDLDIPLEKEHIKVQHVGGNGTGSVTIEAPYTVQINLPGYPVTLQFDPMTTNKGVF